MFFEPNIVRRPCATLTLLSPAGCSVGVTYLSMYSSIGRWSVSVDQTVAGCMHLGVHSLVLLSHCLWASSDPRSLLNDAGMINTELTCHDFWTVGSIVDISLIVYDDNIILRHYIASTIDTQP